jgi:MraZ protein
MERCLALYLPADFEQTMADVNDAPPTFKTVRDYQRWMQSRAEDVSPDGQGRITLTTAQRDWAQLNREVIVIGAGNRLEVWDPGVWAKYQAGLDAQFTDFDGRIVPSTTE